VLSEGNLIGIPHRPALVGPHLRPAVRGGFYGLVFGKIRFGCEIVPSGRKLQEAIPHKWELRYRCRIHSFARQGSIVIRLRAVIADVHHG
jgi:hypothetical protein